ADRRPIILALLLILLLGGIQCAKFVVPVRLEGIGYKSVRRIDVKVASLSQIGLISGSLDLLLAQTVHLIQSGLNLLLDGERTSRARGVTVSIRSWPTAWSRCAPKPGWHAETMWSAPSRWNTYSGTIFVRHVW